MGSEPLKPPPDHDSWLTCAIDYMDTRQLFNRQYLEDTPHWGRIVQRAEMRAAAYAELAEKDAEIERLTGCVTGTWQDGYNHAHNEDLEEIERLKKRVAELEEEREKNVAGIPGDWKKVEDAIYNDTDGEPVDEA